ncbi:MAG: hypothetical protein V4603_01885 [Pseudomonadota bacterium]
MSTFSLQPARLQPAISTAAYQSYVLPDGAVWTLFYRLAEGYLLRFPQLADFELTADGSNAICFPFPAVDEATVNHLYTNQVYPLMLSRQCRPTFHASVITTRAGAVAFLGPSGMGKSTLTAWFCQQGAQFLTDDGMIVEEHATGLIVVPNNPAVRLWEDSVAALAGAHPRMGAPVSYTSKSRLLAAEGLSWCDTPQPLRAAFLLEWNDVATVKTAPLDGVERLMAWVNNSFLLDSEDKQLLLQHFNWVQRIGLTVPTFKLDYPREYARLPEVQAAVRALVTTLVPQ